VFGLRVDDELCLALVEPIHAEAVYHLVRANRAYLARWEGWAARDEGLEGTRSFIRSQLEGFAAGSQIPTLIVAGGRPVGRCSLRIDLAQLTGEVGYWIAADHQGRGLVTRAARALVGVGFTERGLQRVELRTSADNRRSRAVAERLGFRLEGILRREHRVGERWDDLALYAALAGEWGAPPAG